MDKGQFNHQLQFGIRKMGLQPFSNEAQEQIYQFHQILSKWNRKINLTAHREPEVSLEKNFLDCLVLIPHLMNLGSILDLGQALVFQGELRHPL